jgi:antitoxin (DNA-binding transcriptional repressor) of toxin-antitoxin stability system
MSRPTPVGNFVELLDPELLHHWALLLAMLEPLVAYTQDLEKGHTRWRLWTARQEAASVAPPPSPTPPAAIATSCGNQLSVPSFAQLDSATYQARRMCFSSSCAMLLAFHKPGVLTGSNGDDQYLARVRRFGDTTDASAPPRPGVWPQWRASSPRRPAQHQIASLTRSTRPGHRSSLARHGKPIALLVPLDPSPRRQLGLLKGRVDEAFFEPLPHDELELWGA